MTMTEETTTTGYIMEADYFRSVATLGTLCGTDKGNAILTYVKVSNTADGFVAEATDSYVAGRITFGRLDGPDFETLWEAKALDNVRKVLGRKLPSVTLDLTDTGATVFKVGTMQNMSAPPYGVEFPNIGRIWEEARGRDTFEQFSFAPERMAQLSKVFPFNEKTAALTVQTSSATKPLLLTGYQLGVNGEFIIMPVRTQ